MKNIKIDDRNPIQLMPDDAEYVSYIYQYKQHLKNEQPDMEPSQDDILNIKPLTVEVNREKQLTAKKSMKQDLPTLMKTEKQKDITNQNILSMITI